MRQSEDQLGWDPGSNRPRSSASCNRVGCGSTMAKSFSQNHRPQMSKFSDLMQPQPGLSPEELQKRAQDLLPALLQEHCIALRDPSQPIQELGQLLVIGVAAGYSRPDMVLLDDVSMALQQLPQWRVEVFDVSILRTMEDIGRFIPGIGPVYQTPVVALWVDGELKVRKSGKEARDFIRDKCRSQS